MSKPEEEILSKFGSTCQELVKAGKFVEAQVALVSAAMLNPQVKPETRAKLIQDLLRLQLVQEQRLQSQFNYLSMKLAIQPEEISAALSELEKENG